MGKRRADHMGLIGLLIAVGGIVLGQTLEGGHVRDVLQPTAALIVFGGTFGAVILTTPSSILKSALRRLKSMMFEEQSSAANIIDLIVSLSTQARKNGIVALEQEVRQIEYGFLQRGLMLAVDGETIDHIKSMLELEIKLEMSEVDMDAKVLEAAGGYAPTIGILGAVIGLIQVMKHLDNIAEVGSGIAVAFVATIYGVGSANLLFLPIGQKMRSRAWKTMRMKHLMLEGIVSITGGLNPRLVRRRLDAFVRGEDSAQKSRLESVPAKDTSI
jgi:chemotaxis protein MotA